jgi:pimeloyl-ACP methyl ester carboxylesterase
MKIARRGLVTFVAIGLMLAMANRSAGATCVGDCDGNGAVMVTNIILMVEIALGDAPVSTCMAGDPSGDGTITMDEILQAVGAALNGCPASPTPTATTEPTPTATFEPGTCGDPAVRATEPLCGLDDQTFTCDFLIQENCLLPSPSSVFLAPDATTPTGFRVHYPLEAMPANVRGVHVDPTEWNTLDGFSPGSPILALFPQGVDLTASGAPLITDIGRSVASDSPTVIINAATGERILHFTELDSQATTPATQTLIIRPGVRLQDATRYIVAIRGLKDLTGTSIAPQRTFQILRDNLETPVQTINARRAQFEDIFSRLESAGIVRSDLILAWDFTTASTQSLTGRALATRDQGLAANGPGAPPFEVTSVEDNYSDQIFRRVRGVFTVPLFMTSATPPAMYNLDADGVPRQNGTTTAPFTITIPRLAVDGSAPQPGRPVVYGHGLLGTGEGEVTAGNLQTLSGRFNFILGATDWIGLSEDDVPNTLRIISNLSNFRQLADRLQQAFLNFILLGRLMTAPDGLNSNAAFQFNGVPIIDTEELYYYGNSQGGIEGAAYLALSPDIKRGVIGVGAANYSTLLERSVDFTSFEFVFNEAYLNELDRAVLFPLLQQLWDRGEPNGYTPHLIADPLPGTPAKTVLFQMGVHDSQVANIATEIEVRTLGIPALAASALPLFQVPQMVAPIAGSAFVPYDVSAVPEPLTNTAPTVDNGVHEAVRLLDAAQQQINAFLQPNGTVQDFCGGPCVFHNVPNVISP